jgi:hypothetical protein
MACQTRQPRKRTVESDRGTVAAVLGKEYEAYK